MTGPSPDAPRRRWLTPAGLILAAAPWLWFLVRDRASEVLDPVAVGMPIVLLVAVVLGAIAAILRRRLLLLFALSTAVMCVCTIVAPRLPQASSAPDPAIRIATANVYDGNPTPEATIAALRARAVDVLATVEMDDAFWQRLDGIDALPYRVVVGELGVHARWPLALMPAQGLPRSRILRIRVDAPDAPFVLYVAHALNPLHDYSTFADQRAFARAIVAATAQERAPRRGGGRLQHVGPGIQRTDLRRAAPRRDAVLHVRCLDVLRGLVASALPADRPRLDHARLVRGRPVDLRAPGLGPPRPPGERRSMPVRRSPYVFLASARICRAALAPGAPVMPPPGCAPEPAR